MTIAEILNSAAAALCLFSAVRALELFHCRVGIIARAALAALGFFSWAGMATGEFLELRGADQGFLLSLGVLAGVLLWQTRALSPSCSVSRERRVITGSNGETAISTRSRPYVR